MDVLLEGPWAPNAVDVRWRADTYEPAPQAAAAADVALEGLAARGSPSHDSMAARLSHAGARDDRLELELQPVRWALRLVDGAAAESLFIHCLVRSPEGDWLAGRRAPWLAVLPGAWHLGAAGSVGAGDDPIATMRQELDEEWGLGGVLLRLAAVLLEPSRRTVLLGVADVAGSAEPRPNDEYDAWAWWPADTGLWPDHAPDDMRVTATLAATLAPLPT